MTVINHPSPLSVNSANNTNPLRCLKISYSHSSYPRDRVGDHSRIPHSLNLRPRRSPS